MFNVLIYCQVFYLLLLGYYNDNSVVYLEAQLCGSLVLDLAFVILTKGFYLAPERHSEDNVYFVVTLVFLAITAVLRLILIVKLWPFWKPPQNTLFFLLFGNELILHRRSGANILNEAASS